MLLSQKGLGSNGPPCWQRWRGEERGEPAYWAMCWLFICDGFDAQCGSSNRKYWNFEQDNVGSAVETFVGVVWDPVKFHSESCQEWSNNHLVWYDCSSCEKVINNRSTVFHVHVGSGCYLTKTRMLYDLNADLNSLTFRICDCSTPPMLSQHVFYMFSVYTVTLAVSTAIEVQWYTGLRDQLHNVLQWLCGR